MSKTIQRRDFLKSSAIGSLGLVLGIQQLASATTVTKLNPSILELEINPFIIIDTLGNITLVNSRPDMGQGSTQAVPSLLAEELEVDLTKVNIVQSDGRAKYGSQQSGGSSTVRSLWLPLRKAGAAAREMLIEAAANEWKVTPSQCYAKDARVYLKDSGKSLSYGELSESASKLEIPKNPKLKDKADFRYLGKYHKRLDVPSRVAGTAVFGIDVEVPNMLYAVMIHAPGIHTKLVSVDDTEAKAVTGVKRIFASKRKMPHTEVDAIAVVADNYWAALKASKLVKPTWATEGAVENSDDYFAAMHKEVVNEGVNAEEKGDFNAFYKFSEKKLEAVYETPFLAHAAIEPVNATAHVKEDGTVEVWAPIQGPDGALSQVSKYLGVDAEKVKINSTLLGGSFGRKAYMDFLMEACTISKEMNAPVKLVWPREEDTAQGPYRPAMLSSMKGVISKKSNIAGFHHHAIGESIMGQVFGWQPPYEADSWLSGELSEENHKYDFDVHKLSYSRVKTTIPVVWWRSVYASNFAWGQESFLDELAHEAGKDPYEVRMDLLKDSKRDQIVLEALKKAANLDEKLPENEAKGIAMFRSFESMSAACVHLIETEEGIKIAKVTSIIDCGMYINPDQVKAQTEGNIVMGLSAAIKGGITFTDGKCDQSNFDSYQFLRISEMPDVEIVIIENDEAPGGVGEPGLPPIAPALGNAIFNLTGKRIRKLPIEMNSLV
jgi:isoquinoline 1-oxidoreductase beta subunit